MRQGLDWYKREPRAFLDGVQGMGPELIGAYAVLLDLIYARGGETLRDDRHLSGVLGCSTRKAKALTDQLVALGKVSLRDGFVTNSKAEKVVKQSRNVRETNAKHGRMGAEKRHGSPKNNDLDLATATIHAREEKRRVREESPLTPQDGGTELPLGDDPPPKPKDPTPRQVLGEYLDDQQVTAFLEMRRAKKKPVTLRAARIIAGKLEKMPAGMRAASMDQTIERSYDSVFPIEGNVRQFSGGAPGDSFDRKMQRMREQREGGVN